MWTGNVEENVLGRLLCDVDRKCSIECWERLLGDVDRNCATECLRRLLGVVDRKC